MGRATLVTVSQDVLQVIFQIDHCMRQSAATAYLNPSPQHTGGDNDFVTNNTHKGISHTTAFYAKLTGGARQY